MPVTTQEIETRIELLREKQRKLERPRPCRRDHAELGRVVGRIVSLSREVRARKVRKVRKLQSAGRWNEAFRLSDQLQNEEGTHAVR